MHPTAFRFSSDKLPIDPARLKAVAVDLDGTILHTDASLSARTVNALQNCLARGVPVLFCTGRSPVAAEKFRTAIGAAGPMVFYNGAAVIDTPDGRLLSSSLLSADIALGVLEIARRLDIHFHVFLPGDRLVYERDRPEAGVYAKRTGLVGEIRDLETELVNGGGRGGVIKAMFIGSDDKLQAAEAAIDERFGGRVYRARSHATFLELMALGVSKGPALLKALAARGLDPTATMAFGDAENDLPMLAVSGYAVVPANASAAIQAEADLVVPANDEDGPAQFLEEYLGIHYH